MHVNEYLSWDDLGAEFFQLSNSLWALVPLEAWRRGLSVQLQPNAKYTISGYGRTYAFRQTRLSGAKYDAIAKICDDKNETKQILLRNQIPTPQGRYFSAPFEESDIIEYANSLGFPVCLKPNAWAKARGVFPKVENREDFARLLSHLIHDLNCTEILVEEHVPGGNVRVFVAGNKVIAATQMFAANVVGDGSSSLGELIIQKNLARKKNPHLKSCQIVIDEEVHETLQSRGIDLTYVPSLDETVYIRRSANISKGGDSLDITDTMSLKFTKMAIDTVNSVNGLNHAGIDIISENPTSADAVGKVNEINPSAGLGPHVYPAIGEQRMPPSAIVDLYFPESVPNQYAANWYFALNPITRLFTSSTASSVSISPLPILVKPEWRTFLLTGQMKSTNLPKRTAMNILSKMAIHGDVRANDEKNLTVRFVGEKSEVEAATNRLKRDKNLKGLSLKLVTKRPFKVTPGFRSI